MKIIFGMRFISLDLAALCPAILSQISFRFKVGRIIQSGMMVVDLA
jgi:hypothetical protein